MYEKVSVLQMAIFKSRPGTLGRPSFSNSCIAYSLRIEATLHDGTPPENKPQPQQPQQQQQQQQLQPRPQHQYQHQRQ
jgi:hypothetical protein